MKATLFEFRNRRWFIYAIFILAFEFSWIDRYQAGETAARFLALHFWQVSLDAWTHAVFIFAALMMVLSAALRSWGTAYLQTAVMQARSVHTERLLGDGPFRHVRNPLYLGNLFMAVGVGAVASRMGFVLLFVAMFVFHYRLILREEEELSATQGESYREYCARVPQLWFAIAPRIPPSGNRAHWLNGVLGEMSRWAAAIGAMVYAYTFNIKIYSAIFVLSLPPEIWYRFREARKRPQQQTGPVR